jgi:hypothetical protein
VDESEAVKLKARKGCISQVTKALSKLQVSKSVSGLQLMIGTQSRIWLPKLRIGLG